MYSTKLALNSTSPLSFLSNKKHRKHQITNGMNNLVDKLYMYMDKYRHEYSQVAFMFIDSIFKFAIYL